MLERINPEAGNIREGRKITVRIQRDSLDPFGFAVTAGEGGIAFAGTFQLIGDVITSGTVTGAEHITGEITEGDPLIDLFTLPEVPGTIDGDLGNLVVAANGLYTINPGTYTCSGITH